jgi:HSP20 family molecular chaperone IbpA
LTRGKTVDPTGRFEVRDVMHEALPNYGRILHEAALGGTEKEIERAFVQFSAAYNGFVEGVLTMPSYEIVIDTTTQWDAFPTLNQGFKLILADEGRHITFGTTACRMLIEKDPSYEEVVHEVFDAYRGNIVGLVEYQKAVPGLDVGDVDVSVSGDEIVLKGSRSEAEKAAAAGDGDAAAGRAGVTWHRRERGSGGFERRLTLPTAVDADRVEARLVDGVLTITCPKAAELQPRKVAVRAG